MDGLPWKYIGSTSKDLSVYFGSVSSKKWKDWWKQETKAHPENFEKRVLCVCLDDNICTLQEIEKQIQVDNDAVQSPEYFNMNYATIGYFGVSIKGPKNPRWGLGMNPEHKEKNLKVMRALADDPKERKRRSEFQKQRQSLPEVKEWMSEETKRRWKTNPNMRLGDGFLGSASVKVAFSDCEFKNIKELRKQTNVSGDMIREIRNCGLLDELKTLSLEEFKVMVELRMMQKSALKIAMKKGWACSYLIGLSRKNETPYTIKETHDVEWYEAHLLANFISKLNMKNYSACTVDRSVAFLDNMLTKGH